LAAAKQRRILRSIFPSARLHVDPETDLPNFMVIRQDVSPAGQVKGNRGQTYGVR